MAFAPQAAVVAQKPDTPRPPAPKPSPPRLTPPPVTAPHPIVTTGATTTPPAATVSAPAPTVTAVTRPQPAAPASATPAAPLASPPQPAPQRPAQVTAQVAGEQVRLKSEPLRGGDPALYQRLRAALARLPYVQVVTEGFFDRLLRGKVRDGRYRLRLLSGIGDVISIPPAGKLDTLIEALAPHLEYAYIVKQLARIHQPDPSFRVNLSVVGDRRDFCIDRHETIVYQLSCEQDCYPVLLNLDSRGSIHQLFPNRFYPHDTKLKAGTPLRIPNEAMRRAGFELQVVPPAGEETLKVIATTTPLGLDALRLPEFQHAFQTIPGQAMQASSPSRRLARDMLLTIDNAQRHTRSEQGGFQWSEDTVVVRSHERCTGVR